MSHTQPDAAARPKTSARKSRSPSNSAPGTQGVIATRAPLERMLRIHQLVQEGTQWNCARLAADLEVHRTTVQKDITFMRDRLRLPIEFDQVKKCFYYSKPVAEFPSVELSQRELLELAIARFACETVPGLGYMKPLSGLLDKLMVDSGKYFTISGESIEKYFSFRRAGTGVPVSSAIFEEVNRAMLETREIEVVYRKPEQTEPGRRIVQPLHITWFDHTCYAICYDLAAQDYRTFALSRATEVIVTERTFERPKDFCLKKYFSNAFGIFGGKVTSEVRIHFRDPAAFFVSERRWHESQELIESDGTGVKLRVKIAVTPEFERWVLGWGADAEVLEPEWLAERIRKHAREILARSIRGDGN